MSSFSLNKICMDKIVETFVNAPPMIRDMVTENVSIEITKEKTRRIRNSTTDDVCEQNRILIPEIVRWINKNRKIYPMGTDDRLDIYEVYKNFDRIVINTAIEIAEDVLCYTDTSRVVHWSGYSGMDSDSSESDY